MILHFQRKNLFNKISTKKHNMTKTFLKSIYMIKLISICTCSLSSQYGRSSAYLCCEDKEIDRVVFMFLVFDKSKNYFGQ